MFRLFSYTLLLFLSLDDHLVQSKKLYDAIVVGAGAAGCPLAQTLIEGGKAVLLVERGLERPELAANKIYVGEVLRTNCVETFSSQGIQVSQGNCMGGATSFNQGIWIEETPSWVQTTMQESLGAGQTFHDTAVIGEAFAWVRHRVAPEPTAENGTAAVYIAALVNSMQSAVDETVTVNLMGQPTLPDPSTIWRAHSTFEAFTGRRRSADTLLDRTHPNLTIYTNRNVDRIHFDMDELSIFDRLWARFVTKQRPVASCVVFDNGDSECIREGTGKIFVTAGVFRTPHLLHKSGIGPFFGKVHNPEVGQNLQDKPMYLLASFFQTDFDYQQQLTVAHIAATTSRTMKSSRIEKQLLFEETSTGYPSLFDIIAYERLLLPDNLRDTVVGNKLVKSIDECNARLVYNQKQGSDFFFDLVCQILEPFVAADCHSSAKNVASLLSNPSSTGRLRFAGDDGIAVDVNYLSTEDDLEALGALLRIAYNISNGVTGPSANQRPCTVENDKSCSSPCSDFMESGIVGAFVPATFPTQLGKVLAEYPDDLELGKVMRRNIVSPHHLVGTARVGSVIDSNFLVVGTQNLYVADSAALPKTPRVNSMPTVMMLGRLVGELTLKNWG